MKLTIFGSSGVPWALFAMTSLIGCGRHGSPDDVQPGASTAPSGTITVDGSSTVLPLSKAIAEAFQQASPAVQIAVASSGSGGGFKKLCAGEIDIADASRPINAAEAAECKARGIQYVELPIAFDSIAVVAGAKNAFVDCLTVAELKTMWEPAAEGKVKTWNQIRTTFPSQPLSLFGPGRASGTFDYFTLAIVGQESSSRNDYSGSEDDMDTVRGVAGDPNALGYFGYAYYAAHKDQLKLLGVDSGHGCIVPSSQTVVDGTYQPLLRPLFIYVNARAAARLEVAAFTRFYLASENVKYVTQVGYVPLSNAAVIARNARFENRVAGSALGGHGSVTGVKFNAFDDDNEERDRAVLVQ